MDPYTALAISASRHADLVREADESRIARAAKKAEKASKKSGERKRHARVVRPATV